MVRLASPASKLKLLGSALAAASSQNGKILKMLLAGAAGNMQPKTWMSSSTDPPGWVVFCYLQQVICFLSWPTDNDGGILTSLRRLARCKATGEARRATDRPSWHSPARTA
jgi:hypothetical protein